MKLLIILVILGLLVGFGTLLKLMAFSIIAILGLPLVAMLFLVLLYQALR
jgi:hypothetical protein